MHKKQKEHLEKLEKTLTEEEMGLVHKILAEKSVLQKALEKHPVLLAILGVIGLVSLFYGVEKLLDKTFLIDHPIYLLIFGFLILYFTGLLLKKL